MNALLSINIISPQKYSEKYFSSLRFIILSRYIMWGEITVTILSNFSILLIFYKLNSSEFLRKNRREAFPSSLHFFFFKNNSPSLSHTLRSAAQHSQATTRPRSKVKQKEQVAPPPLYSQRRGGGEGVGGTFETRGQWLLVPHVLLNMT